MPSFQGAVYKPSSSGGATLTTTAISSVTASTASSGGDITLAGASSVTARGACWNTSPMPTLASGNFTSDGSGTGSFSSSITGLNAGATYYVRAYATNASSTAYGDEKSFTTSLISIGATYQGGKVAYLLASGDPGYDASTQHGLILTAGDLSSGIKWYNGSNVTTSTSTAFGTGSANTAAIILAQGAGSYAAQLCDDLDQNGYTDWYLPSKDELNKINLSRASIGDGSLTAYYWSSSESSSSMAWQQNFAGTGTGPTTQVQKFKSIAVYKVRAVRSF
ncbi:MAG: DUF1566 domain-containing protein [Flavitalea sp.]